MAQWRKVIVSGSNSELNNISSSGDFVLSTDGAKMKFGADNEVTLTHVHNDGLLLSDEAGIGTTKLSFGDAATFVQQQADGELGIDADVKVDINSPAVSMSNDLHVGGDIFAVGNITFQGGTNGTIQLGDSAGDNISAQGDFISSLIPNAGDSFDLGSTNQRWNNLFLSGSINANGGPHDIDSDSTITIDSVGATSIDAGAASNFSTSAGALTLAGDDGVLISGNASEVDITTTGNIDLNGATVNIDGTANSTYNVTGANLTLSTTTSGGVLINSAGIIDIDSSDNITIDAGSTSGISLDGTAASNFTVTGGNLTLSTATSGNLILNSVGLVDIDGTTISIDGSGFNVGVGGALPVDIDATSFDLDATGVITLNGAGASHFTLSDGDLSLIADGSDNKVVIRGDHESDVAIHIDGNAEAASIVDIDAGVLNIDSAGNTTMTAATNMVVKGNSSAKYGDDVATLDFDGSGAISETGATTISLTPSSTVDIDADGAVSIDSSAAISIGGDADAQAINLGTGAAQRTITVGNATGNTKVDIDTGTGGFDLDAANGIISLDTTNTGTGITIGTATAAVPVTIGNGTSEVTIGDNLNVAGNAVITGDLDVNGTLTTIDTTNLQVKDAFVQLASGSNTETNAGIIANTTADGKGTAFYYDGTNNFNRWALTGKDETAHNATGNVVPRQFIMTVSQSAESPAVDAVPGDFGDNDYSRRGMVYIQTGPTAASSSVAGDIWIYS